MNISHIFYNCTTLVSLQDISDWKKDNINDMSYVFYNYTSLSSLPDISNWKTNDQFW